MTKYNFKEETTKAGAKAAVHPIVQGKIKETLRNMGESEDGLLAMALGEIAEMSAQVCRAQTLDRDPASLLIGVEPEEGFEYLAWDPVIVMVMHPDKTIQAAMNAIDGTMTVWDESAMQSLIEVIKAQI